MFCDSFRYEKSSEYEKDKRIRNITNSAKQRSNKEETTEEKENRRNMSVQNRSRNALINISANDSSAKPPQSPKIKSRSKETTKPETPVEPTTVTSKITRPRKPAVEEITVEQPAPRKSWREKVADKELEEKKRKEKEEEEKRKAQAKAKSLRKKIESQAVEVSPNSAKPAASSNETVVDVEMKSKSDDENKQEAKEKKQDEATEEEDTHGTKKMKSDFDAKMLALEEEMSAGKSKLAKLRERIRKAKGVVKEADKALEDSKRS